ncbi:hypothetical protein NC653_011492 [Populus alba x Populus x berolinensis]|uniref:Uncharacterized protein n=1 Tax=Populus alba x Populus x berolinensis TaxID=444605 RepID=A0AAD6W6F7_9ROSI|nr:hypothetical protein NC653_011492 [Populus alba x Populus x berolinensis]
MNRKTDCSSLPFFLPHRQLPTSFFPLKHMHKPKTLNLSLPSHAVQTSMPPSTQDNLPSLSAFTAKHPSPLVFSSSPLTALFPLLSKPSTAISYFLLPFNRNQQPHSSINP